MVAPDKFRGSLTAPQVAASLACGLRQEHPALEVRLVPVADGGEGMLQAVEAAGFPRRAVAASGPTGERVEAAIAVRDGVGVVELAQASGLGRLPSGRREPLRATSKGVGDMVRAALDAGCREIAIGLGGSACTDGGVGMAGALGVRFLDRVGAELPPGGGGLGALERIDCRGLDRRLATARVVVATDVDNPLWGPSGAAAVYGPQKGASPADVVLLDGGLRHLATVVQAQLGVDASGLPGAGAAGGVGFGAIVFLGAEVRPGIELVLELVDFAGALPGAALVVTGEGSLDRQSLRGKAPVGVARAAARAGVPVVAAVGQSTLSRPELELAGLSRVYALQDLEPDLDRCIAQAGPLLRRLGARIAADWLGPAP